MFDEITVTANIADSCGAYPEEIAFSYIVSHDEEKTGVITSGQKAIRPNDSPNWIFKQSVRSRIGYEKNICFGNRNGINEIHYEQAPRSKRGTCGLIETTNLSYSFSRETVTAESVSLLMFYLSLPVRRRMP